NAANRSKMMAVQASLNIETAVIAFHPRCPLKQSGAALDLACKVSKCNGERVLHGNSGWSELWDAGAVEDGEPIGDTAGNRIQKQLQFGIIKIRHVSITDCGYR